MENVGELSVTLTVDGLEIDEIDVRQLSAQWCSVVGHIDYPSSGIALSVLSGLINAYLRGRGCRMGNIQGQTRHYKKVAVLTSTVLFDATERYAEMARFHRGVQSYLHELIRSDAG